MKNKIDLLLEILEFRYNYIKDENPQKNKSFIKLKMLSSGVISFLISENQVQALRNFVHCQPQYNLNVFCLFNKKRFITCRYSINELENDYFKGIPTFRKDDQNLNILNYVKLTCNQEHILNKPKTSSANDLSFILKEIDDYNNIEHINIDFKTKPYDYQDKCSKLSVINKKYGLFLDVGLGKSKVSIDAMNYMLKNNIVEDVIILCPASLKTNWEFQLTEHADYDSIKDKVVIDLHSSLSILDASIERYNNFLSEENFLNFQLNRINYINSNNKKSRKSNVFTYDKISNYDLHQDILSVKKELSKIEMPYILQKKQDIIDGKTLVIIDESHKFKEPNSNRTKKFLSVLSEDSEDVRLICLTGTPNPKGYIDLFIYGKMFDLFLDPDYTKENFIKDFFFYRVINPNKINDEKTGKPRSRYSVDILIPIEHKKVLMDKYIERLQKRSIWIDADEVIDLPDKIYDVIMCPLSETQNQLINKLMHDTESMLTDQQALLLEKDIKNDSFIKIQQIQGGFLYDKTKQDSEIIIKDNPRLDVLLDVVENILLKDEKIIIFTVFNAEVKIIEEFLRQKLKNAKICSRSGFNSKQENEDAKDGFQNGDFDILIGTQDGSGTGFTFIQSNHIIFYSCKFDADTRTQAEGRIRRIGQNKKCHYYDILSDTGIDKIIYNVIVKKQNNIKDIKSIYDSYRKIRIEK